MLPISFTALTWIIQRDFYRACNCALHTRMDRKNLQSAHKIKKPSISPFRLSRENFVDAKRAADVQSVHQGEHQGVHMTVILSKSSWTNISLSIPLSCTRPLPNVRKLGRARWKQYFSEHSIPLHSMRSQTMSLRSRSECVIKKKQVGLQGSLTRARWAFMQIEGTSVFSIRKIEKRRKEEKEAWGPCVYLLSFFRGMGARPTLSARTATRT